MKRAIVLAVASTALLAGSSPGVAQADTCGGKFKAFKRCVNSHLRDFHRVEDRVANLRARVQALESSDTVAGVAARVTALEAVNAGPRLNTLEGRVDTLASRTDNIAERVTTLENVRPDERLTSHGDRLDALEARNARLRECIDERSAGEYTVQDAHGLNFAMIALTADAPNAFTLARGPFGLFTNGCADSLFD